MHYWRKGMFEAMRDAAEAAAGVPEWADYAEYCRLREQGLRQQSLDRLNAFLTDQVGADFERRLAFVRWVMTRVVDASDSDLLISQPLYHQLIRPTLREWVKRQPLEALPHFWLGMREHNREELRRAIELDPPLGSQGPLGGLPAG